MKKYLVFDVGCIECGEESQPVGVYDTEREASEAIDNYIDDDTVWGREDWHGQHDVSMYEIEV